MIEWLNRTEASLNKALEMAERGGVIQHNLYMLATILYSEEMHTSNESLLEEMSSVNEKQVQYEWSVDEESKYQYKFHYVSSYLCCFVVAGKIDEMKYDRIMDYVTARLDLFTSDYDFE